MNLVKKKQQCGPSVAKCGPPNKEKNWYSHEPYANTWPRWASYDEQQMVPVGGGGQDVRNWPLTLLVLTDVYPKPVLSALPSLTVPWGSDVTLRCQSHYNFDQFALYKEGTVWPPKKPEEHWYRADFPLATVNAKQGGTYRCYSFSSSTPYLWSAPSDPLKLVIKTGVGFLGARTHALHSTWLGSGMVHVGGQCAFELGPSRVEMLPTPHLVGTVHLGGTVWLSPSRV